MTHPSGPDWRDLPAHLRHHADMIQWRLDHHSQRLHHLEQHGNAWIEWAITAISILASLRPDFVNALIRSVGLP